MAAIRAKDPNISDKTAREQIAILEGTGEIFFTKAEKGAKIYSLAEGRDEDDQ